MKDFLNNHTLFQQEVTETWGVYSQICEQSFFRGKKGTYIIRQYWHGDDSDTRFEALAPNNVMINDNLGDWDSAVQALAKHWKSKYDFDYANKDEMDFSHPIY